jgi:Protein of unknown function (DUF4231)
MVREASLSPQKLEPLLSLVVIAAGAATLFFQVFTPAPWVPPVTAGLGALVTLSEGWQRIARYGETWVAYRSASERMKRARRLYANGAGPYRGLDDDAAYLQLVENVEAILAEEQQVYWRNRGGQDGAARQTVRWLRGWSGSIRDGNDARGPAIGLGSGAGL